jgi:hypothetical protein
MMLTPAAAAGETGKPTLGVCVASRTDGALTGKASTIYRVTIDWNGTRWPKEDRVDIGIWDYSELIWRQGHFADIRSGKRQSVHEVVVQDAGVYPMTFGVIRMSPELVREADILCQRGFCSLVPDAPGLTELTDPEVRAVMRLEAPGLLDDCSQ